jgi:hypothetical protein
MKKIPLTLALLFLIFSLPSFAQEKELAIMAPYIVGGKWTGKLTQKTGGISQEYEYEVDLTLKNNIIGGKAVIKTASMYANFEIKGTLSGTSVNIEDIRITNENIRDKAAWCIKKLSLKFLFRDGAYRLEGAWSGRSSIGDCQPGYIYLRKAAIKA